MKLSAGPQYTDTGKTVKRHRKMIIDLGVGWRNSTTQIYGLNTGPSA